MDALDHPDTLDAQAARLTEVEHWADEVTHQVIGGADRTFVTPWTAKTSPAWLTRSTTSST